MQRWLAGMYERHGSRYVWFGPVGLVCAYVLGVIIPLSAFVVARYEGLSVAQCGVTFLVLGGGVAALLAGAFWARRSDLRVLSAWASGGREPDAAGRTMRAAHELPRGFARAAALCSFATGLPALMLVLAIVDRFRLADAIFVELAGMLVVIYGATIAWSIIEATLRPLIADLAIRAPSANRIEGRPTRLSFRMVGSVALVGIVGGLVLGGLVLKFGAGANEALRVLGFSCLVGLTLVMLRIVMVTLSVMEPIRELIHAARTVAAGDLEVRVPVASIDELGALSESFNEMVVGLREREALRDRNAELVDTLRASQARIVTAADAERRRVERDLHDGAQQQLVLLGLKLGIARRALENDPAAATAMHDELRADLDRALAELRDLAHGIYPALLENEGLPGALHEAASRAPIPVEVDCDGVSRYPPEVEAAIYFCCLEALQNAAKHAGDGARAIVRLRHKNGVAFEIADDGAGFDPTVARESAGLQNMSDRIGALSGSFTIDSTPGSGTSIRGTVPAAHIGR